MARASTTSPTAEKSPYLKFKEEQKEPWFKKVAGFFHNIGTDAKEFGYGFFPGLKMMITHPLKSFEMMQESMGERSVLGPLAVGVWDFANLRFKEGWKEMREADKRAYEHPLDAFFDISAIFSLGAGSAVKGAGAAGRLGAKAGIPGSAKLVEKAADLTTPKAIDLGMLLGDPREGMVFMHRSGRAGTRIQQEVRGKISEAIGKQIPMWENAFGLQRKFEKGLAKEVSRRKREFGDAERFVAHAVMQGAENYLGKGYTGRMWSDFARNSLLNLHRDMVDKAGVLSLKATAKALADEPALPKGYSYIKQADLVWAPKQGFKKPRFLHNLREWQALTTTKEVAEAVINKDGRLAIVSDASLRHLVEKRWKDMTGTEKLLKAIWREPITLWKWSVLSSPRYGVNTVVGTSIMAAMTSSPMDFFGGIMSWIRETRGLKAAADFAEAGVKAQPHWLNKWYKGSYAGYLDDINAQLRETPSSLIPQPVQQALSNTFFKMPANFEQAVRGIMIRNFIAKQPEFKAMRKKGISEVDAFNKWSESAKNRAMVFKHIEDRFGQYYHYNKAEDWIRKNVRPFYGWDRAIMRHTWNMSQPRRAFMYNLGIAGALRTEELINEGEPLPEGFLQSLVPIGELGKKVRGWPDFDQRFPAISTGGMNPYAAVSELTTFALGEAPADLMQGINPLISQTIAQASGVTGIGAPAQRRFLGGGVPGVLGLAADVGLNTLEDLPQSQLVKAGFGLSEMDTYQTREGAQPFLFSRSWQELLAGYLGIPVKFVSPAAVQRRIGIEKKLGRMG